MKKAYRSSAKGFTLIELAVVIAIIAILAAVAIPRFGNTTAQAECSNIKDFVSQLNSAMSIYTAENAATPGDDFTKFVTAGVMPAPGPGAATISVKSFGSNSGKGTVCAVAKGAITCPGVFNSWTPSYSILNGVVSVAAAPAAGNTLVCK